MVKNGIRFDGLKSPPFLKSVPLQNCVTAQKKKEQVTGQMSMDSRVR